jgi:hypothetical protein
MVEVRLDRSQRSRTRSRMRESNAGQRNGKSHVFGFSGFPQTCFLRFKRLFAEAIFLAAFRLLFRGIAPACIPFDQQRVSVRQPPAGNHFLSSCPSSSNIDL